MPAGRPSKYQKKFCKQLVKWMSRGQSFESFCKVTHASFQTMYRWVEEFPEFREAFEQGRSLAQTYWETIGQAGTTGFPLTDDDGTPLLEVKKDHNNNPELDADGNPIMVPVYVKNFRPDAWKFWMSARFGWKEKSAIEHTGNDGGPINITDQQVDERINALAARLGVTPKTS